MNDPLEHLPLTAANLVDRACLRFEADWKNGRDPRIEDVLAGSAAEEPARSALFQSLLLLELELRGRAGEQPDVEAYQQRFPEYAELVAEAFQNVGRRSTQLSRDTSRSGRSPASGTPSNRSRRAQDVEPLSGRFGRYRIVEQLGRGGMGAVYLAEDTELGRQVALKVPFFDDDDGPEVLERFQREAKSAAAFEHPNICPIYDVGEQNGTVYLTMPFIDGTTLSQSVGPETSVSERQAAQLVIQLAEALQEAHAAGIVHRDLKPANVMINQRKQPLIMDFGLARRMDEQESRITKSGTVIGTPAYMPPEQVRSERDLVGPRSDIYSLGAIFYELLSGHPPFEGSLMSVLGRVLTEEPAAPSQHRADLDQRLEAICQKMMAKQPADRYGSMTEVAAALCEYLQTADSPEDSAAPWHVDSKVGHSATAVEPSGAQSTPDSIRQQSRALVTTVLHQARRVPRWVQGTLAAIAGVLLLAVIVISISTPKGTVQFRLSDPSAEVAFKVDGDRVDVDADDKHYEFDVGWHSFEVSGDGFQTVSDRFKILRGENPPIKIDLVKAGSVVASKEGGRTTTEPGDGRRDGKVEPQRPLRTQRKNTEPDDGPPVQADALKDAGGMAIPLGDDGPFPPAIAKAFEIPTDQEDRYGNPILPGN